MMVTANNKVMRDLAQAVAGLKRITGAHIDEVGNVTIEGAVFLDDLEQALVKMLQGLGTEFKPEFFIARCNAVTAKVKED